MSRESDASPILDVPGSTHEIQNNCSYGEAGHKAVWYVSVEPEEQNVAYPKYNTPVKICTCEVTEVMMLLQR